MSFRLAPSYPPIDADHWAAYSKSSATRPVPTVHKAYQSQIDFLLSTLTEGNYNEKRYQIRLLSEQHGLDTYLYFIRRLIVDSQASSISTAAPSSTFDASTPLTFRLLVQEIRRLARDPFLANHFRDGIDKGDGDIFRDFDVAQFVDRVGLCSLERLILASAIVSASYVRRGLAAQAMTIVHLDFETALLSLSQNPSFDNVDSGCDLSPSQVGGLLSNLLSDFTPSGLPILNGQQRQALIVAAQAKCGTKVMAPILKCLPRTLSRSPDTLLVQTLCGFGATSKPSMVRELLLPFGISELSPPTGAQVVQIVTTLSRLAAEGAQICDVGALIRVLSDFNVSINWPGIIEIFDLSERTSVDTATVQLLIAIILNVPRECEPHAVAGLWSTWSNSLYQLRLLDAVLSLPADAFNFVSLPGRRIVTVDDIANVSPTIKALADNVQGLTWNSLELFEVLVALGDSENVEIKMCARDILDKAARISAELVYLGILQVPNPWNGPGTLNEYSVELLRMFLAGYPNDQLVFLRMWQIDKSHLIKSFCDYYNENPLNLTRILDIVASIDILDQLWDILDILLDLHAFTFALEVAALASWRDYLNLRKWLTGNITNHGAEFLRSVVDFLQLKASSKQSAQVSLLPEGSKMMPLNPQTVSVFLCVLRNSPSILNEADMAYCLEVRNTWLQIYPRLVNISPNPPQVEPDFAFATYTTEVETEVAGTYQQLYDGSITVDRVIRMLQHTKKSAKAHDHRIFSCMLHFLFGEYKFFQSAYPPRKLAITGHLFGSLIQHSIVDGLPLSIAICYVLDALQCPLETDLFKFGVGALCRFTSRLPEWQLLCEKLLQIRGLRVVRPDLVDSIRHALFKPREELTKENPEGPNGIASETNHHVFAALKLGELSEESEWHISESEKIPDKALPSDNNLAPFHFGAKMAVQKFAAVETLRPRLLKDPFAQNSYLYLDGHITRLGTYSSVAGGSADIWEGYLEDKHVAVKVLRQFSSTGRVLHREKLLRRLWREYLAWFHLSHPNVLVCLGFSYDFSVDSHRLPSLISPWMSNGTALDYLETHPDMNRRYLTDGIAEGLCYLHTRDPPIVHGDIRAGNILIANTGAPCLSDFGLSRTISEVRGMTTSSEVAGSMRWMSPELLYDDNGATIQSDVWAFGMTLLEILSGDRPYSVIKRDVAVFGEIIKGRTPLRPEEPSQLSDHLWNICQKCWSSSPQRPAMDVVKSQLTGQ